MMQCMICGLLRPTISQRGVSSLSRMQLRPAEKTVECIGSCLDWGLIGAPLAEVRVPTPHGEGRGGDSMWLSPTYTLPAVIIFYITWHR